MSGDEISASRRSAAVMQPHAAEDDVRWGFDPSAGGCVQRELSASGAQNVCDTCNTRCVQYHVDAHGRNRNIGGKSISCHRQKCKLLP